MTIPNQNLDALKAGFTKMYEGLSEVIAEIRHCERATLDWAESQIGDADVTRVIEDPPVEESQEETPAAKPKKPAAKKTSKPKAEKPAEDTPKVTPEEVRAELKRLVKAGQKDTARELLQTHGGDKLSEVPEANYPDLLAAAKKVA